jgi:hypothetical protein
MKHTIPEVDEQALAVPVGWLAEGRPRNRKYVKNWR